MAALWTRSPWPTNSSAADSKRPRGRDATDTNRSTSVVLPVQRVLLARLDPRRLARHLGSVCPLCAVLLRSGRLLSASVMAAGYRASFTRSEATHSSHLRPGRWRGRSATRPSPVPTTTLSFRRSRLAKSAP
jgi:hypothetical protein